ncbi:MAG: hypothetical protein ACXWV2_05845 [Chitinophagaceae bacterium]
MQHQLIPTEELHIVPSATSSANDFDFFAGHWNIHNRRLKTRLNGCTDWIEFEACQEMRTILNGIGNIDNFKTTLDGCPFEGMTLRLFNPITKLWSIYWADSNKGVLDPPVVGSFENNIGLFYGNAIFNEKLILVKFRWDKADVARPVWSQAFSEDNGKTWEWNWYMYMTKAV